MGGRCSPDIQYKQGAGNHEHICSFGFCIGTYFMKLQHTLELLSVLHGTKFLILAKDEWIQGQGQN